MHSDSLFAPGDQEPCGTGCCEGAGAVLYCAMFDCAEIACDICTVHRQPLPDMGGRGSLLRIIFALDFALIVPYDKSTCCGFRYY